MPSITNQVKGRVIDHILMDGNRMTICATNGQEFRIIWVDDGGRIVKGEPKLEGIDAKIILTP